MGRAGIGATTSRVAAGGGTFGVVNTGVIIGAVTTTAGGAT